MKVTVIGSETDSEDDEAAAHINRAVKSSSCDKIVWYSKLGRDMEALRTQERALLLEVSRLADKVAEGRKAIKLLTDEVKVLSEKVENLSLPKKKTCKEGL